MIVIIASVVGVSAVGGGTYFLIRRTKNKKRPIKTQKFTEKWRQLQKHCKDRNNWPFALIEADDLLNKALKRRRYKGSTMGARLMAAQREITDNDGVWAAHNLAKKMVEAIEQDKEVKLSKKDVLKTLQSFRNALIDLGALKTAQKEGDNE